MKIPQPRFSFLKIAAFLIGVAFICGCERRADFVETTLQDCVVVESGLEILGLRNEGTTSGDRFEGHTSYTFSKSTLLRARVDLNGASKPKIVGKPLSVPVSFHDSSFKMLADPSIFLCVGPAENGGMEKFGTIDATTGTWNSMGSLPNWYSRFPNVRLAESNRPLSLRLCAVLDGRRRVLTWSGEFRTYHLSKGKLTSTPAPDQTALLTEHGSLVFPENGTDAVVAQIRGSELLVNGNSVMKSPVAPAYVERLVGLKDDVKCILIDGTTQEFVFVSAGGGEVNRVKLPPPYSIFCSDFETGIVVFGYVSKREGDVSLRIWNTKTNTVQPLEWQIPSF
jgi:hypothetical protein